MDSNSSSAETLLASRNISKGEVEGFFLTLKLADEADGRLTLEGVAEWGIELVHLLGL